MAKLEALLGRIQKNRRPPPQASAPVQRHASPVGLASPAAAAAPRPAPTPPAPQVELVPPPEEQIRAPRPTPMEMALEEGFDAPDEQLEEVEITIDDNEDEVMQQPTAPIETRAPRVEPVTAPRVEPPRAEPPRVEPVSAPPEPPIEARPIPIPAVQTSAPVVRAVSPVPSMEPLTFGQLLDRTLALRKKR